MSLSPSGETPITGKVLDHGQVHAILRRNQAAFDGDDVKACWLTDLRIRRAAQVTRAAISKAEFSPRETTDMTPQR